MADTAGARKIVVGITGASGACYALKLLEEAAKVCTEIYVILSDQAAQVINLETEQKIDGKQPNVKDLLGHVCPNIHLLDKKDFFSPPASGSFQHDGMVIVPCSMGTIGRIANGISNDLMTRAADVCLKEKRKLILVPRETPWNLIHLRNMTQLAEAGATILPASPGFYHKPADINGLVNHIVGRIMQQLGLTQNLVPQWQYSED